MGLAGPELRSRAQSSSSEPHRTAHRCSVAPPEISVTKSRTDCALTQQMVGGIKAISLCVKSASGKLFLDLHTVLAPSVARSAERVQPHRSNALHGAAAALTVSGTHAWCGHATVMVLVSSASRPRVSGCTRVRRCRRRLGAAVPACLFNTGNDDTCRVAPFVVDGAR